MLRVSYKDRVRVLSYPYDKWVAEYCSSRCDEVGIYFEGCGRRHGDARQH